MQVIVYFFLHNVNSVRKKCSHHLGACGFSYYHEFRVETKGIGSDHSAVVGFLGDDVKKAYVITALIHEFLQCCQLCSKYALFFPARTPIAATSGDKPSEGGNERARRYTWKMGRFPTGLPRTCVGFGCFCRHGGENIVERVHVKRRNVQKA